MIIIARFVGNITQNFILGKTNINVCKFGCKRCSYGGRLHRHGTYSRNVITISQIFQINIQRFKCPICKKTCSMLPSFLIPYFQYSFDLITITLYIVYTLYRTPSHVPALMKEIGSHCHISLQSILFYMKRFNSQKFRINSFFTAYDSFYYDVDILSLNDFVAAGILLKKIFLYNRFYGSFNLDYQMMFRNYFMSP